jgi:excinuclease UvrABC nuclease subunit
VPERKTTTFDQVKELPKTPAVYFIWKDGVCVYVGCSANLWQRIAGHNLRSQFPLCERLEWIDCPTKEYGLDLERDMIQDLKPIWNGNTRQFRKVRTITVSFKLSEHELHLLDLVVDHISKTIGSKISRASAVRFLVAEYSRRYRLEWRAKRDAENNVGS